MESAHVSATGRLSSRGHPPKLSLLNVGARRMLLSFVLNTFFELSFTAYFGEMDYTKQLRWDSRAGSRPGPRDPGLQKPWIPGTDLGQGQIPQFYSIRLNFFAVTLS